MNESKKTEKGTYSHDYFKDIHRIIEEKNWLDAMCNGQGICVVCRHDDQLDLELHHIAGRENSPILVSLCRNCHYRISKVQNEQWPEDWYKKKHSQARKNAYLLRGLSDLLRLISDVALDRTNR